MPENHTRDGSKAVIVHRPRARTVIVFLVGVFVVLATLDVLADVLGKDSAARLVSLDAEATIGTWWAGVQLVALAALLYLLTRKPSVEGDRMAVVALRLGVVVAVYLSIDEVAGIHELLSDRLGTQSIPLLGRDVDRWLVLYSLAAIIVIALAAPGLVRLWRADRVDMSWLGLGAGLVLFGGVLVENVRNVRDPTVWDVIFEESFEFIGVAVMIWAAYRMLSDVAIEVPPTAGSGADAD